MGDKWNKEKFVA